MRASATSPATRSPHCGSPTFRAGPPPPRGERSALGLRHRGTLFAIDEQTAIAVHDGGIRVIPEGSWLELGPETQLGTVPRRRRVLARWFRPADRHEAQHEDDGDTDPSEDRRCRASISGVRKPTASQHEYRPNQDSDPGHKRDHSEADADLTLALFPVVPLGEASGPTNTGQCKPSGTDHPNDRRNQPQHDTADSTHDN